MTIEKSKLKMAVLNEIGGEFDDSLEVAEQDIYRWEGAKTSLKGAKMAVERLLSHVRDDVKGQKITEEGAEAAQKYIRRAAGVIENLQAKAEVHEQRSHGRVEALRTAVKVIKKKYDAEEAKAEAQENFEEISDDDVEPPKPGPADSRPVGTRPPNKIAALKRQETPAETAPAE